jgi:hypothetical protein
MHWCETARLSASNSRVASMRLSPIRYLWYRTGLITWRKPLLGKAFHELTRSEKRYGRFPNLAGKSLSRRGVFCQRARSIRIYDTAWPEFDDRTKMQFSI